MLKGVRIDVFMLSVVSAADEHFFCHIFSSISRHRHSTKSGVPVPNYSLEVNDTVELGVQRYIIYSYILAKTVIS